MITTIEINGADKTIHCPGCIPEIEPTHDDFKRMKAYRVKYRNKICEDCRRETKGSRLDKAETTRENRKQIPATNTRKAFSASERAEIMDTIRVYVRDGIVTVIKKYNHETLNHEFHSFEGQNIVYSFDRAGIITRYNIQADALTHFLNETCTPKVVKEFLSSL